MPGHSSLPLNHRSHYPLQAIIERSRRYSFDNPFRRMGYDLTRQSIVTTGAFYIRFPLLFVKMAMHNNPIGAHSLSNLFHSSAPRSGFTLATLK